jgi:hypothetical protein
MKNACRVLCVAVLARLLMDQAQPSPVGGVAESPAAQALPHGQRAT